MAVQVIFAFVRDVSVRQVVAAGARSRLSSDARCKLLLPWIGFAITRTNVVLATAEVRGES